MPYPEAAAALLIMSRRFKAREPKAVAMDSIGSTGAGGTTS